jgi:peptidoglycan L-alanyl-D-glutamate endopeptidase CwlK
MDLHPKVQVMVNAMLEACIKAGFDILITSTYRDAEAQNALYAQGRTKKGSIVTNAKGGESIHNYRLAFDIVPLRSGKPVWGTKGVNLKLWKDIAKIGKACGLEWAGDWKGKLQEMAHFQYTQGLTLKDLQNGKTIK